MIIRLGLYFSGETKEVFGRISPQIQPTNSVKTNFYLHGLQLEEKVFV